MQPLQAGQVFHVIRQGPVVHPAILDRPHQPTQRDLPQLGRLTQITRNLGQRLHTKVAKLAELIPLDIRKHAVGVDRDTTHGRPPPEETEQALLGDGRIDQGQHSGSDQEHPVAVAA